MRFFKIITIILLSVTLLIAGFGIIVVQFYEDDVKAYIIGQLNRHLNTQVILNTADIHLSVFQNFPNTSLEFNDVKALDANWQQKKDTLFKAGKISLQFNLLDLFKKNYRVKEIEIQDVTLKLKIDQQGNNNYRFWKSSGEEKSTSFAFDLEKFGFKNVSILYEDLKHKQYHAVHISAAGLTGSFSEKNYSLHTKGELLVHYLRSDSIFLLKEKPARIELELAVNSETNVYNITKSDIQIADLNLEVKGSIIHNKIADILNLAVTGKKMNIQSIFSLLPAHVYNKTKDYNSSGNFYFEAGLKGAWSSKQTPQVNMLFGIDNGSISKKNSSITLKKVHVKGSYSNGTAGTRQDSHLSVKNFTASLGSGTISGNFRFYDFNSPFIECSAKASLSLNDLNQFIKLDTIESINGSLKLNTTYKGRLKSTRSYTASDFRNASVSGEMILDNTNIRFKNNSLKVDSLTSSLFFHDNDIVVNHLKGKLSSSDFALSGFLRNILAYTFLKREVLTIDATFISKNINLNEILSTKNASDKKDTTYIIRFPERVDFNLNSTINRLVFRKFEATQLKGAFKLKDQQLTATPVSFSTMDGEVLANVTINCGTANKVMIASETSIKKINIYKLFHEMENFGQEVLIDKNLKGILTADIQFSSSWKPNLSVDLNKIYTKGNLTIEKGELINFEPMKALSRFIKLSELEHIKFSTLQNQIEIKNQKIYIPKMEVKSNVLNVTGSGVHSFNNDIDYHIKLLLSELLAAKAKKAKKENEEFGVVEDDGLGKTNLFLSMTGTVENPIIKYDQKGNMEKIKHDIRTEKQKLKTIIKEEFGWAKTKKDSSGSAKPKKEVRNNGKFKIKWGDGKADEPETEEEDF